MHTTSKPPLTTPPNTALAVSLFRDGAVSASLAARMAGMPMPEMLTLLSSLGIPLNGDQTADNVREEMRRARDWLTR